MRTIRMPELAAIALVVVPNGVSSPLSGCCGPRGRPDAPDAPEVRAWSPEEGEFDSTSVVAETGDTAAPPVVCDGEPALALYHYVAPEPLPDELFLSYGGSSTGCGSDEDEPSVVVAPTGLLPGSVGVTWTLTVEGEQRTGQAVWDLECRSDGVLSAGGLDLDLPESADDTDVKLLVEVADVAGTTVAASHTFRAHVTQE